VFAGLKDFNQNEGFGLTVTSGKYQRRRRKVFLGECCCL